MSKKVVMCVFCVLFSTFIDFYFSKIYNYIWYKYIYQWGENLEELKDLQSLKDIINIRFEKFLDKVAFIEKEPNRKEFEKITYKQVRDKINGLGTYMLNDLNLKGEKIAVLGENSSRWYMSYMAIACGVGIVVPLDKGLPENEILNLLKRCGAKAIIYSSRRSEVIQAIKKDLPEDMVYIDMNKAESDDVSLSFDRYDVLSVFKSELLA